jgi:hypothetical protein
MTQAQIALAGGAVLIVLGLVSVLRPREFWGQDLNGLTGKGADIRRRLVRRRWQIGTVGFFAAGLAFASYGVAQIMGW